MIKYKIKDNAICGYEDDKIVSILLISDPVARSKRIVQLSEGNELED
tara:strand:+ start:21010 stop:21150 length:141 start_codon:yes stop_codon:yes gene_type:complete